MVAIWRVVVAVARCKMEGSHDLFIKEGIFHRVQNIWVDAEGKFTHITGAVVGIKYLIDSGSVVGSGFDNFSIFKGESNIFKCKALENSRCIVGQSAVDGIFDRSRVDFTVRNIHVAGAFDGRNAFDGEGHSSKSIRERRRRSDRSPDPRCGLYQFYS